MLPVHRRIVNVACLEHECHCECRLDDRSCAVRTSCIKRQDHDHDRNHSKGTRSGYSNRGRVGIGCPPDVAGITISMSVGPWQFSGSNSFLRFRPHILSSET